MQMRFKEESVQTLKQANEQYRDKAVALEEEVSARASQVELMLQEMQTKEDEIEQLYLQKEGRAPSTYMVEIAQLKEDNLRLMSMLRGTKEFKEFAGYVEDSGGDVRHLEDNLRTGTKADAPSNAQQYSAVKPFQGTFQHGKASRANSRGGNSRTRARSESRTGNTVEKSSNAKQQKGMGLNSAADEHLMTTGNASEDEQALNDNWIPNSAYNLAHGFKQQHGDELTVELVNEMLKDLNRIYRERERKQVQRVKQQSQEEINKLKRKLTYRPTYDEVGARKNKQTLKRQITALTSELEQLQGRKKQALALQNTPAGVEMVQNNLIMVTKMQQQRKEMEAENAQLKHNLTRIT